MSEKQKKVVIAGAYGCGNVGDDAILAGLLRLFNPSAWDVTVLAAGTPRIQDMDQVKWIRQQLNMGLSWSVLKTFDLFGIFRAISRADLLLIGGGALLHDLRFYNLPYFFMLHSWAKLWGTRVVYIDIGAGPIHTFFGRWLCRQFLAKADHISVRDQQGKSWLQNSGLRRDVAVTADPAFMLKAQDVPESIGTVIAEEDLPDQYIAVTICGWFKSEDFWNRHEVNMSRPVQRTAEILDWLIEKTKKPLVFFPTVVPHDRTLAAQIAGKMVHGNRFQWLKHDYTVEILMGLFGKSDWLFGMRLHSMILSTIMNVPFFAVVYDQKVTNFMDTIGNVHRIALEDFYNTSLYSKLSLFLEQTNRSQKTNIDTTVFQFELQSDYLRIQSLLENRSREIQPDAA